MLANSAVRNLIREGKIFQLPNTIRMNAQHGMKLLDQALIDLYKGDLISIESLLSFCDDPDEVTKLIGHSETRQPVTPGINLNE